MDAELVAMMTQTIYVASAAATLGAHGEPTWGAAASRLVHVERSDKVIRGVGGEEFKTSHLIFTTTAIGMGDRVWLPGDSSSDATKARRVMLVEPVPGESSTNTEHWEVYV